MDKPAFPKKSIFINSFRRKNDVQMCTRVRRPKGDKCRVRRSPVDIFVFPADLSTGLCIDWSFTAFDCSQASSNIVLDIEKREQFAGLNRPAHDRLRRGAARMPTRGETGNCPLRVSESVELAPRAGLQIGERPWPDRHADQSQGGQADGGRHASHLAVAAFAYRDLEPAGRHAFAETHRGMACPEQGFGQPVDLGRGRAAIHQVDALAQLRELTLDRFVFDLNPIRLGLSLIHI